MSFRKVAQAKEMRNATPTADLVAQLSSEHGALRTQARAELVRLGSAATADLLAALADPRVQVRWEATKALAEIADPESAEALVQTLRDEDFGVRWLASEGLIRLGREGLIPLLEALARGLVSERFRAGAHHVIRAQLKGRDGETLRPVYEALGGFAPRVSAPLAARRALAALEA